MGLRPTQGDEELFSAWGGRPRPRRTPGPAVRMQSKADAGVSSGPGVTGCPKGGKFPAHQITLPDLIA